jgi:site-specific DNA recombinase
MERFVVEQIKRIGQDPAVLEGTLRQMRQHSAKELADLQAQHKSLERELARHHASLKKLVAAGEQADASKLAELNEQIHTTEQKRTSIGEQMLKLQGHAIDQAEVASALSIFDPVWEQLAPKERARVTHRPAAPMRVSMLAIVRSQPRSRSFTSLLVVSAIGISLVRAGTMKPWVHGHIKR